MGVYSAAKENKTRSFAGKLIELKLILLDDKSDSKP